MHARMKRAGWLIGLSLLALVVSACGRGPSTAPESGAAGPPPTTVKCGSQGYAEVEILCEMAGLMIQARTPHGFEHVQNLGSSLEVLQAMKTGDLDMSMTFTGTHFLGTLEMTLTDAWRDPDKVWQYVHDQMLAQHGMWVFGAFGYNNVYALTVRAETADELGLVKASDVAPYAAQWVLGTDSTFQEYPGQGYKEWTETYGFRFKDAVAMDYGLMYRALRDGNVDAIMAYSTDGRIPALNLRVLEDDKAFNPPYYGIAMIRNDLVEAYPEIKAALEPLEGLIDTDTMAALNREVDVDEREPRDVARDFLKQQGLID